MTAYGTNENNIAMLPRVGNNDWNFAFQAGLVRSMESSLLTPVIFQDMAAAADLNAAIEILGGSEYSMSQGRVTIGDVEKMLVEKRQQLLYFYANLLSKSPVSSLGEILIDMSNLRLALRRFLTEKPIGTDYCPGGSQLETMYETIFEQNDYCFLPTYMQTAIEQGILAYYADKDVRAIDYAVDQVQFDAVFELAQKAECSYLQGLVMAWADLTNIKTVMRKKLRETDSLDGFIAGGFLDWDKLKAALHQPEDQFSNICYATPYASLIEAGIDYLTKNNSFLRFEALCDKYMDGCYDLASQITAGIQPAIAYFYKKSEQIRKIRMVLTAKSNLLDKQLILDRLGA